MQQVKLNESTAAKRRLLFYLVSASDGITPYTGAAGAQPKISTNGGAFTTTNVGVLVSIGSGHYYADVNAAALTAVCIITGHFDADASALQAPSLNSLQVVASDPYTFKSDFTLAELWGYTSRTLTALGGTAVASIWDALLSGISTSGSIGKLLKDNVDATISSRSNFDATVDNVNLASTGLNNIAITEFNGRPSSFPQMVVALFMRFYNKVTQDSTTQTIYRSDDTTPATTATVSEAAGVQTKGKLS